MPYGHTLIFKTLAPDRAHLFKKGDISEVGSSTTIGIMEVWLCWDLTSGGVGVGVIRSPCFSSGVVVSLLLLVALEWSTGLQQSYSFHPVCI